MLPFFHILKDPSFQIQQLLLENVMQLEIETQKSNQGLHLRIQPNLINQHKGASEGRSPRTGEVGWTNLKEKSC